MTLKSDHLTIFLLAFIAGQCASGSVTEDREAKKLTRKLDQCTRDLRHMRDGSGPLGDGTGPAW